MQEDLNELYSDRVEELKDLGVEAPLCEGIYSNIDTHFLSADRGICVRGITNWRPSNSSEEPIFILAPFEGLFEDNATKEQVEKALDGTTIEVTKIDVYTVEIDGKTVAKMKINWKYVKPLNDKNNGN